MKSLLCAALLLIAATTTAQTPEPMPLAHGSAPGEPHHHLKIENEYIRAYYVEVPPHESTQLHQHDHDYIYVSLSPSDVVNAVRDKPEVHLTLRDGETHFTRGGFAHVARNLSDSPFRNITIELLETQNDPRNLCARYIFTDPIGPCPRSTTRNSVSNQSQFSTDKVSADLVTVGPDTVAGITPQLEVLFVVVNASNVYSMEKGKLGEKLFPGEVMWLLAGSHSMFSNEGHQGWSYLTLTFKGSPPSLSR